MKEESRKYKKMSQLQPLQEIKCKQAPDIFYVNLHALCIYVCACVCVCVYVCVVMWLACKCRPLTLRKRNPNYRMHHIYFNHHHHYYRSLSRTISFACKCQMQKNWLIIMASPVRTFEIKWGVRITQMSWPLITDLIIGSLKPSRSLSSTEEWGELLALCTSRDI